MCTAKQQSGEFRGTGEFWPFAGHVTHTRHTMGTLPAPSPICTSTRCNGLPPGCVANRSQLNVRCRTTTISQRPNLQCSASAGGNWYWFDEGMLHSLPVKPRWSIMHHTQTLTPCHHAPLMLPLSAVALAGLQLPMHFCGLTLPSQLRCDPCFPLADTCFFTTPYLPHRFLNDFPTPQWAAAYCSTSMAKTRLRPSTPSSTTTSLRKASSSPAPPSTMHFPESSSRSTQIARVRWYA